jgi:hypothetical protein
MRNLGKLIRVIGEIKAEIWTKVVQICRFFRRLRADRPGITAIVVKLHQLLGGEVGEQGVRHALVGTGTSGDGAAFDHRRCGKDDLAGVQGGDDASDKRRTAIGTPGGLCRRLDHKRQIGPPGWPEPEGGSQQTHMIGHCLQTPCILGKRRPRHLELSRQPGDQGIDRFVDLGQDASRVTQQGELYGKAKPIGGSAAAGNQSWSERVKV